MRGQVGPQPRLLRRTWIAAADRVALGVEGHQVPTTDVVAVVALVAISGPAGVAADSVPVVEVTGGRHRRLRVARIKRPWRLASVRTLWRIRQVLVVTRNRTELGQDAPPRRAEEVDEELVVATVVLIVAERENVGDPRVGHDQIRGQTVVAGRSRHDPDSTA